MTTFHPVKRCAEQLGVHWAWLRDRRLRGQFIEGVHYRKVPGIRGYCYNTELCGHWIDCGGDPILHQAAIDQFLASQRMTRILQQVKRGGTSNG
ncbi:hypothetical protein LQF76_12520 [Gloeomargaritales cyanobacterium VI4D9]|nr:hypothetical protein LQF76_12520 [Gloeomargaritales cyanobacterium VI4D9]